MEYWKIGLIKSFGSMDCFDVQGGIEGKLDVEFDVICMYCMSIYYISIDCICVQGEIDEVLVYFDDGCYLDYGFEDECVLFLMVVLEF